MPKMQVYLPDELYLRVKAEGSRLNVSRILQEALVGSLADLERRDALAAALRAHEAEAGAFTDEELAAQEAADQAAMVQPPARRPRRRRAAG